MRRTVMGLALLLVVCLGISWLAGGLEALQVQILESQRQVQGALAGAVRAIKGGQPGALAGLLAVCFSYGVLHAAGPGHGKLVIGGYGMGRRVPMARLAGLALAASLAQAAVAVALVYGVVAALGLSRDRAEGLAEGVMAPAGLVMMAGVGLWLVWRGWQGVQAAGQAVAEPLGHGDEHPHDHRHDHAAKCASCGHAHGPTLQQVQHLTGWRDAAALVAGIALRPCSGALFLLVLTWQLGIAMAGIGGVFAMGLGTAVVTIGVAVVAVLAREGALASLPGQGAARALPWFELLAGTVVVLAALSLLSKSL